MARTLSFARRPLSKEEEAELYAAAPDEVLSPGSAQVLRSALQAEADETIVASSLVCPITNELMTDPVFTMDGQTYERAAIEAWLRNHDTSPATGKPLPSKKLVPNVRARSMLRELPELTAQAVARLGLRREDDATTPKPMPEASTPMSKAEGKKPMRPQQLSEAEKKAI